MQRFHAGSCTSAVNNSALSGIQARDTSRVESSSLPSNFSVNSRRSSQLTAYNLKCDKEQLNARLGPPDLHPQTPNCPEETLTREYAQSGYRETVEGLEEAREISLSQIQAFTKPIIVKCKEAIRKCHRAINESRAQKRKAGQVYGVPLSGPLLNKPGAFPDQRPCGEDFRKKWIEGLSQPHKRLRSLADHVPHGYRRKSLFEVLIRDNVPLMRATWFIKVTYLNQVRATSSNSLSGFHDKSQFSRSEQWTKDAIEYLQNLLDDFMSRNHSHSAINIRDRSSQIVFAGSLQQKGNSSSAVMNVDEPSLYTKWWYVVRIVHWHHAEGLVVPSLIIDWVLNQLQEKDLLSVLQLLLPVIYGFVDTVVSSQTYVRTLVGIAFRFIREPSPGGSDLVENSRRAYTTSAVVEMLRYLILAVPDTFVALDCFPLPMCVVSPIVNDGNFLSKMVEDTKKLKYGHVEVVAVLRDRNYEVQAELLSFPSVVSSIQKRAETLSRAARPDRTGHNVAKAVQTLDKALMSGDVGVSYNLLFESCWDGLCAERWSADVCPCLRSSLKHIGRVASSLMCSVFFICEWATCEYRNFRSEPPHGLKFTGRKDVSQIFIAIRLLKLKMINLPNFCGQDQKIRDTSDIFESPGPLHDIIVCWIDQHEVHNGEGFKRLQLLVGELIRSGIFNPLAYGRQLIVSGMMDGNGPMVDLAKQKRHYKLLKHLPASYIHDLLEESQISELSILVEATNIYSNERRLVLHGPTGQNKSTTSAKSGTKRRKYHFKSGIGFDSPSSVDQWYFQATSHSSTVDVDADRKLDDVKAAVSILLQFPHQSSYTMDSGVDESLGYTKRPSEWYNSIGGNQDTSVCEECRRIKRQKLSEEQRPTVQLYPVEDELWWVRKEMKYIDSSRAEQPPKPSKQMPRSRQKSGRKTQSLAQLAAARIEGSQGASTSHVCEGRMACPHHRSSSDNFTKLVNGTGNPPLGDIVSVGKFLKQMRFVEKRRLMVWLVSVVKQLIEESEKTTTKASPYGRSTPAGDDRNSRHWRLGEDELSAILFLMDVCNEFVSAARFLLWLLPRVPCNPPIFGRSPVIFSRTVDNNLCEVGEALLLSLIRSYENTMVAADLIPEMLSSTMRRVGMQLTAKGRLSGSIVLVYARQLLKKYSNIASVVEWEKTFKSTCDRRLISEMESSRSFEGDFGFNLGVPNGVEDLDDYFRQKINSVRVSRVGMSMKEIVHRHVDEAFQYFYSKDRKVLGLGTNKNSSIEKWDDGYQVAHQIVTGLMECMRNTGGAAQEGDPSLVSSAIAAIISNVGLVFARIPDLTAGANHLNATSPSGSLHFARRILRIHITCLCILKDALGERQSRVFEVALATEASSTLLQAFTPGKAPRSQFQMSPESQDVNANIPNESSNHSNKTVLGRGARIMASVSALVIGCILQGVASLERMVALFRLKEGLDIVQFVRSLKSNVNGNARSMGSLKAENLLEVSVNWFRVLVGNCRTVSDGLIVDLLGEASIVSLSRMQRSLTLNLIFPPAYSLFAFLTWKPILDATVGVREDFHRVHQSLAFAIGDAIKHSPFHEICFQDTRGLYDLISADTLDYDFVSLLESNGSDSYLKVSALVPLRSRLFLDALIDCKVPEPVVKLDGSTWIIGHGELKRQCGENVKRLMGKLVHVLDTLQPAKFHWQWVEIRLLLNEQAINEKMMENDVSFADAIRSLSPHADKSSASENESNFVQIILTRLLVRPGAAPLFSEAVRLFGKSLEDSMLSQAKWLLRGAEVLYGKKSIGQKIMNIASDLKELSLKPQYWKPWGWCNTAVSPVINKGDKWKSEAGILEEGEVVDEGNDSAAKVNGLLDVDGFVVSQQHLTERALIELILPCVDQGSDDLRNNFANEMIKQMSNIEQQINAVTRGVCKLPATASPAIGSPANKSGSRKSGKGGSPIISRQLPGSTDSVPPSPAALRASMTLRLQFLLRLLPIICTDREPSTRNMRYALASVILRLLGSRVVHEDSCHFVNTAVISSKRNVESLMEASNASTVLCGESLFDSLLLVLHVLLSNHQPSWLKTKSESKSTEYSRDYVVFDREVAESMQNELDHMELPEAIRWRIQTAMPIILPSSRFPLSCQPPSLPPSALACLQPSNPVTSLHSSMPQKNPILPGRASPSLKTKPQLMQQDLDADIDQWTLLEDGAGSGQPSPNSAVIGSSDHANLKAIHWLKGAVRVRRTDLTYVGAVDDEDS